jgi:anti-anti-sigma factor
MKNNPFSELIARSCLDKVFREEFINHPVEVLRREGIQVPQGLIVKVIENTDNCFHVVLPGTVGTQTESWECERPSTTKGEVHSPELTMSWETGALCLIGRITSDNAQHLLKELDKVDKALVIDFSEVSFMGSAGLAVLFATQKRLSKKGQQVFLCEVPDPIRNLFQLAGMEAFFKFVGKDMKNLWWMAFPSF